MAFAENASNRLTRFSNLRDELPRLWPRLRPVGRRRTKAKWTMLLMRGVRAQLCGERRRSKAILRHVGGCVQAIFRTAQSTRESFPQNRNRSVVPADVHASGQKSTAGRVSVPAVCSPPPRTKALHSRVELDSWCEQRFAYYVITSQRSQRPDSAVLEDRDDLIEAEVAMRAGTSRRDALTTRAHAAGVRLPPFRSQRQRQRPECVIE